MTDIMKNVAAATPFADERERANVVHTLHLLCAATGVVPSLVAARDARWKIMVAGLTATTTAVLHASLWGTVVALSAVGAVDAGASVCVTLVCAMSLHAHKTVVGVLRALWLVVLVTSSCTFEEVRRAVPQVSFVPNDVTIFALLLSAVGLAVFAWATRSDPHVARDGRTLAVDAVLASGALCLRFRDDVARVSAVDVALALWHVSLWTAVLATLCILRHPRPPPPIELDTRDQSVATGT